MCLYCVTGKYGAAITAMFRCGGEQGRLIKGIGSVVDLDIIYFVSTYIYNTRLGTVLV